MKADELLREMTISYSICTIITRPHEYAEMVESFRHGGFVEPDCEFLYLDNSQENAFEAFDGYNLFLNVARGARVILCHQDIQLIQDGRAKLDAALEHLTQHDPNWAVCGNAGAEHPGQLAIRITDPHGDNQQIGAFPVKVRALDENFIVVRRSANLALSRDLSGFHFYGTDICVIADILGWSSYVIDFHLRHKSPGTKDKSFFHIRQHLVRKYRRATRSRWIATTNTAFFLSGNSILGSALSGRLATKIVRFLGRYWPRLFRP